MKRRIRAAAEAQPLLLIIPQVIAMLELSRIKVDDPIEQKRLSTVKLGMNRTYGAVQDYITKYGHEPEGKPWGVESEMVKGHTKQGRGEQHWTPFGLLGAIADGFEELAPHFQEYAAVFKGRKQLNFSPGFKACYQEEEKTDEELAGSNACRRRECALSDLRNAPGVLALMTTTEQVTWRTYGC
jgi:hypothetical protein